MRTAKSAGVYGILGASLAAIIVPGSAYAERAAGGLTSIDSSSTSGIDTSTALSIDSGSGLSIDSSSGLSIDSSSGYSIDSSSALSIDSSSGLSIDSSSGYSIDSSSALSIDSSSGLSIDSSSGLSIDSSSVLLAGPVETIDHANGVFVSLGQSVRLPGGDFGALAIGDFVTVGGTITAAGSIDANIVTRSNHRYVPGATEVFVTGIPSAVDFSLGIAKIGDLTFDYTPSLGGSRFEGIGAAISVSGVQPALGGIMISDRVLDKTDLFLRD